MLINDMEFLSDGSWTGDSCILWILMVINGDSFWDLDVD